MDMVKGMLLSQIYPMKLINVSVSSKHCHPPSPSATQGHLTKIYAQERAWIWQKDQLIANAN